MSFFRRFQDPAETALQATVSAALKDDIAGAVVELDRVLRAPTFLSTLASNNAAFTSYVLLRFGRLVDIACPAEAEAAAMTSSTAATTAGHGAFWESGSTAADAQTAVAALTTANARISDALLEARHAPSSNDAIAAKLCGVVARFCHLADSEPLPRDGGDGGAVEDASLSTATTTAAAAAVSARHALRILACCVRQSTLEDPPASGDGSGSSKRAKGAAPTIDLFGGGPPVVRPHLRKPLAASSGSSRDNSDDEQKPQHRLDAAKLDLIADCAVAAATRHFPESQALLADLVQRSAACADAVCRALAKVLSATSTKRVAVLVGALELAAQLVGDSTPQSRGAPHVGRFVAFVLRSSSIVSAAVDECVQDETSAESSLALIAALCKLVAHRELFAGSRSILLPNGSVLPGVASTPLVPIDSGAAAAGSVGGAWAAYLECLPEQQKEREDAESAPSASEWSALLLGLRGSLRRLVDAPRFTALLRQESRDLLGFSNLSSVVCALKLATAFLFICRLVHENATAAASALADMKSPMIASRAGGVAAAAASSDGNVGRASGAVIDLFAASPTDVTPVNSAVRFAAPADLLTTKPPSSPASSSSSSGSSESDDDDTSSSNRLSLRRLGSLAACLAVAVWQMPAQFPCCSVLHTQIVLFAVNLARTLTVRTPPSKAIRRAPSDAAGEEAAQQRQEAATDAMLVAAFESLLPLLETAFAPPAAGGSKQRRDSSVELHALCVQLFVVVAQTPLMKRLSVPTASSAATAAAAASALPRVTASFIREVLPSILERGHLNRNGALRSSSNNNNSSASPRGFDMGDFAAQGRRLHVALLRYCVGADGDDEAETSCQLTLPSEGDSATEDLTFDLFGGGGGSSNKSGAAASANKDNVAGMDFMVDAFEGGGSAAASLASPVLSGADVDKRKFTLAIFGAELDDADGNKDRSGARAPAVPGVPAEIAAGSAALPPVRHRPVVRIPKTHPLASGRGSSGNLLQSISSPTAGSAAGSSAKKVDLFDIDGDDDNDDDDVEAGGEKDKKAQPTPSASLEAEQAAPALTAAPPVRVADLADVDDMGLFDSRRSAATESAPSSGAAAVTDLFAQGGAAGDDAAAAVGGGEGESPILLLSESPVGVGATPLFGKPQQQQQQQQLKPSSAPIDLFGVSSSASRSPGSSSPPPASESPAQTFLLEQQRHQQQQRNDDDDVGSAPPKAADKRDFLDDLFGSPQLQTSPSPAAEPLPEPVTKVDAVATGDDTDNIVLVVPEVEKPAVAAAPDLFATATATAATAASPPSNSVADPDIDLFAAAAVAPPPAPAVVGVADADIVLPEDTEEGKAKKQPVAAVSLFDDEDDSKSSGGSGAPTFVEPAAGAGQQKQPQLLLDDYDDGSLPSSPAPFKAFDPYADEYQPQIPTSQPQAQQQQQASLFVATDLFTGHAPSASSSTSSAPPVALFASQPIVPLAPALRPQQHADLFGSGGGSDAGSAAGSQPQQQQQQDLFTVRFSAETGAAAPQAPAGNLFAAAELPERPSAAPRSKLFSNPSAFGVSAVRMPDAAEAPRNAPLSGSRIAVVVAGETVEAVQRKFFGGVDGVRPRRGDLLAAAAAAESTTTAGNMPAAAGEARNEAMLCDWFVDRMPARPDAGLGGRHAAPSRGDSLFAAAATESPPATSPAPTTVNAGDPLRFSHADVDDIFGGGPAVAVPARRPADVHVSPFSIFV